jgi:hypothetical protein
VCPVDGRSSSSGRKGRNLIGADAGDAEALIDVALGEPPSRSRDLRLTVLLSRLAELGPKRAVDFSRTVSLETDFVVPSFGLWATRDADAAIRERALISPGDRFV